MRSVMRLSSSQSSSGTVGGHDVDGVDGADDRRPLVGAHAVAHAGGAHVGHHGEVLPRAHAGRFHLLAHDGVGLAQRLEAVARDGTEAAHAQAGTGEGLALHHGLGQAELAADHAHLVLVEQLDGLDQSRTAGPRAGRPRYDAPSRRPWTRGCRGRWCPGRGSRPRRRPCAPPPRRRG